MNAWETPAVLRSLGDEELQWITGGVGVAVAGGGVAIAGKFRYPHARVYPGWNWGAYPTPDDFGYGVGPFGNGWCW